MSSAHGAGGNTISVTHADTTNASSAQHPAAPPPEKQDFVVKDAQGNRVNAPTQSGAGAFYPVAGAHTSQKPTGDVPGGREEGGPKRQQAGGASM